MIDSNTASGEAPIVAIGAPALSVLIFEVLLNATSMFNHANMRIPAWIDRVLRWLVVTPDMHRVHHSAVHRESNHNFGNLFPWWDHVFRTYQAQPHAGHDSMQIGVAELRTVEEVRLWKLLFLPFRTSRGDDSARVALARDPT